MRATRVSIRRQTRSLAVRDSIVLQHMGLVKAIAIRVHENLPVHVDLDDLIHAGVLGLIDAVEKYDSDKNVAFQSYAKHRVKGAILDSLRDMDWASRDMRKRQRKVDTIVQELSGELERQPTESEVADKMGMSLTRWRKVRFEMRTVGPVSADSKPDPDIDRAPEFEGMPDLRPDRIAQSRQLQSTLARAMGQLPQRYQKVVFLYYTNNLTMREIGDMMGVNESRVSQIHKTALQRMAVALQSEGIHSAEAF
ncbi:MAG TPA: FliA/WhiG family RNA polymerase sigma factor [Candidatus Limnocylindrales bacterium]|nr:FliA/WhiG family RNA polymerase sigma factor [Candidatus Limnocylindrales bacterium]